jgi:competence protein ComEC
VLAVAGLLGLSPRVASARGDKDCADFPSQKAAQIFFIKHGGPRYDPDRLDGDHDGKACEDNPAPYYYGSHLP